MKKEITHPLERYKLIADPTIRQQCIDNFDEELYIAELNVGYEDGGTIADAIYSGFDWDKSPQGYEYWEGVHNRAVIGILPLLPEPIEEPLTEPTNEPNELNQLRTENEKLRDWIKNIVNRESMYTVKGQGKTLTAKEIREAKQLLNK